MSSTFSATRALTLSLLGLTVVIAVNGASKLGLVASAQGSAVLPRASKSSTIALTSDDKYAVMVNPEDDSISVFATNPAIKRATIKTGTEPSSVVIDPDNVTAFVANRADATVVKVTGINGNAPRLAGKVAVGSEPTGLALSPSGAKLFVAEFAEGRISVIDTASMKIVGSIDAPNNPRAVSVTNNGNNDDNDELVIVPEFYGTPGPGPEASDEGRTGLVRIYKLSTLEATPGIKFAPLDSGFVPEGTSAGTVKTSPNQLSAVAIQGNKIYATSVSASPKGPSKFNGNVFPVLYVGDLESRQEDTGSSGTVNLAKKIAESTAKPKNFLADMVDISFIGNSNVAYTVSKGADAVQRVAFGANGVTIGSQFNTTIDVGVRAGKPACQNPTGIVAAHNSARAFVNCWVSRSMAVLDLSQQKLDENLASTAAPTGKELDINKGRRFYFTGRGRWSKEAWSSCGSCHPDGLSDNITWIFGTGPRQTTDMSGSFSHGPGRQKQRIFNWTGIFEEMHDFERNTRDTSGGLGAVTTSGCGDLLEEQQVGLAGNLDKPVRESQNEAKPSCTKDWDEIELFVKTIRPPKALQFVDKASVARGEKLFGMPGGSSNNGGCVACHGGQGWTVSRLSFEPSSAKNAELAKAVLKVPIPPFAPTWNFGGTWIQAQPAISDTTTGPAEPAAIGPKQVTCVLRNVGTFGVPGNASATDALEKKPDNTRAQGRGGFNVPSLYGLALGAPYFHHGQAKTLEDVFDDPRWEQHLQAANPVFLTTGNREQQKKDLINFLLSIDAEAPEQSIPTDFDICQ
jgi:DNA-binding beta-propeller fold protein YncE/cytochrome c553